MNDLDALERELGPALRSTFHTCLTRLDERAVSRPRAADRGHDVRPARPPVTEIEEAVDRRGHRALAVAMAAAVLVVGIVGVVVVTGGDEGAIRPAAPASNPPVDTRTTASDVPADLGMALPGYLPEGYVLDDISLSRSGRFFGGMPFFERTVLGQARYLRRSAGRIEAMLTATVEPLDDRFDTTKGSITVHGGPAQIYDSGEGIVIRWAEGDRVITVTTAGLSWDEAATFADRTVIDPLTDGVSLDESLGFELAEIPPARSDEAVEFQVSYRSGTDQNSRVDIGSGTDTGHESLELVEFRVAQQGWSSEAVTVGGLPAIVLTPPTSGSTPRIQVRWIDGDTAWSVIGRLPAETLIEIADSLASATLDQARRLRAELDADIAALAELDRMTIADGIELSVHTMGNGVGAYCIHQAEPHCEWVISESSLFGEYQPEFTGTVWIGDDPWLVGWAEGEHVPTVFSEGGSGGPIVESASDGTLVRGTAAGTFIAVRDPAEDFQFSFDPGVFPVYSGAVHGSADPEMLR